MVQTIKGKNNKTNVHHLKDGHFKKFKNKKKKLN